MSGGTAKQKVLAAIEGLPADATLEEAVLLQQGTGGSVQAIMLLLLLSGLVVALVTESHAQTIVCQGSPIPVGRARRDRVRYGAPTKPDVQEGPR